MARALPAAHSSDYADQSPPGDWQALRGELVALLDQVEGQYTSAGAEDPAFAGFAQRMRDLRYQVAAVDPDDRRREALRSVKRQIDRFTDREEPQAIPHADNVLQSAIQQIRARTQGPIVTESQARFAAPVPERAIHAPAPTEGPRFDELARSMTGLSGRLGELEVELKLQRGNASQVKEIADQVSQLSQVVELLAGAVGETGQVKRLESQIAGLAQLVGQAPAVDLTQLTERLDAVSATVDRLADLQVQQIQHVVREAEEAPHKDAETAHSMRAIEEGVRSIYDRLDGLEANVVVPPVELERIAAALAQITSRLGNEATRPERLLGLVDALNSRINEVEDGNQALGGLKGDIEALRTAVLGAIEPRFASIETQLGEMGERLATRGGDGQAIGQLEAQIRQLVARMDQTGEQLSNLASLYSSDERHPAPDFETLASMTAARTAVAMAPPAPPTPPNFEQLAELAATRAAEEVARNQAPPPPPPDFEALADMLAARTAEAIARLPTATTPDFEALADLAASKSTALARKEPSAGRPLSEAGLAEFEARITRLVDGLARTKAPEGFTSVENGIGRVVERLTALETALTRRDTAPATPVVSPPFPAVPVLSGAVPKPRTETAEAPPPVDSRDAMPRNPAVDAPLKEFGFPDLGPVRAALEAKNGPRKPQPAGPKMTAEAEPRLETQTIAPEIADALGRAQPVQLEAESPPPEFDPARIARPPRPESSLEKATEPSVEPAAPVAGAKSAVPVVAEVPAASRNTFIEAARRAAQRQGQAKAQAEANSLISRAFSRFGADEGAPKIPAPEPAPTETGRKVKPRKSSPAKPKAAAVKPELPTESSSVAPGEPADATKESFLLRHRRPILLAASLVAVSFMTLNLVMQRLAANDSQSAPAASSAAANGSTATSGTPTSSPAPSAPAAAAPASNPASPDPGGTTPGAPKPVSEAVLPGSPNPAAVPVADVAPRVIPTDPVTTASIDPGAAMSFAPVSAETMPPALAAANSTAAASPTANSTDTASAPTLSVATAGALPATAAAAASTSADAATTPAAMTSPVKVELPPDNLGPLDLRQAAADGDTRAQFEIAAIYSEGRAVPQDFKQASIWYERAAAQGFGPAQYRLGNLYENGKGVTKDIEQARLWYERAAEGGNRMAMHNLAALYAGGQFGKQDFASAAEWFQRAANLGMKDSQFNLGMLYARGLGVQQNLETSYKWFALAATGGDADAGKARDNVARSLDAAVVKRLSGEVAAWKPAQVVLAANFAPIGTWEKAFNPGPAITDKGVVTKVQVALMRLGYDIGTPDGHVGPKTTDAIKAFEQGTGMTQVGAINPRLIAVLGSQPV